MTPFWPWVGAGCMACALLGFSAVRVGARFFVAGGGSATAAVLERQRPRRRPRELLLVPSAPAAPAELPVAPPDPAPDPMPAPTAPRPEAANDPAPDPMPAPTAPRPEAAKLALWAVQIRAGERKMSIATDGCRVTWNRTCRHGHPTWIVYLGYL